MKQRLRHLPLLTHGLTVFAILLHGCSCSESSLPAAGGSCVPSYLAFRSEGYMFISGNEVRDYSGSLIGCRRDLENLDDQSMEQVHTAIEGYLRENDIAMLGKFSSGLYRQELPDRINAVLGRVVVTDIMLRANIFDRHYKLD